MLHFDSADNPLSEEDNDAISDFLALEREVCEEIADYVSELEGELIYQYELGQLKREYFDIVADHQRFLRKLHTKLNGHPIILEFMALACGEGTQHMDPDEERDRRFAEQAEALYRQAVTGYRDLGLSAYSALELLWDHCRFNTWFRGRSYNLEAIYQEAKSEALNFQHEDELEDLERLTEYYLDWKSE